jgi:DNA-binding SARP family transcriptional activator
VRIDSRKARALLAYLAMPVGHPCPRAELAALLWPHASALRARASLRRALSDLRSALEAALDGNREMVWLRPEVLTTDVERFVRATWVDKVELLGDAATKYTGDFLVRFSVDSEAFTRWQLLERQYLRSRMLVCRACEHALRAGTQSDGTKIPEYDHAS